MNKEEEADFKRRFEILWRGAYGDEKNDVLGFVDEIKELKKGRNKLKNIYYVAIGIVGTLQFLFWLIDKLHIKLF
jgi:hypothetical protein